MLPFHFYTQMYELKSANRTNTTVAFCWSRVCDLCRNSDHSFSLQLPIHCLCSKWSNFPIKCELLRMECYNREYLNKMLRRIGKNFLPKHFWKMCEAFVSWEVEISRHHMCSSERAFKEESSTCHHRSIALMQGVVREIFDSTLMPSKEDREKSSWRRQNVVFFPSKLCSDDQHFEIICSRSAASKHRPDLSATMNRAIPPSTEMKAAEWVPTVIRGTTVNRPVNIWQAGGEPNP